MATHKELITSGKFDEKFKRALLDYYSYGFKNLNSFDEKRRQTLSEDWFRLNRVVSDYFEWSENRNDVMFASADSQSMESNPFHRIYRFCKYTPFTSPAYFLHTMAALSNSFELRDGIYALELNDDQGIHLEDVLENKDHLKTSDLIYFYTDKLAPADGNDKNKTPNNRLDDLAFLGLVACNQKDGSKGGKGDRRWSLPGITMQTILETGNQINKNFEHHLHSALDYFSKYYLYGEVGTFLLDRLCNKSTSPFRFKHEYFMQALNDFNILDLQYAMEQNQWCRIKYRHGISGVETELLCYPLEIRVSNMQGREFLMFYEPFLRSYSALRIEFIDSIELYDDKKIKTLLKETKYHDSSEAIENDIANAKSSLKYSWGVSTTKNQKGNAITPANPHLVSLQIAYNPTSDYYIANRIDRERRFGTVCELSEKHCIHYTVNLSDEVELRPWMRSFYSRIISCSGMDTENFSLEKDVEKIVHLLIHDELTTPSVNSQSKLEERWKIPDEIIKKLGNGAKARNHDLIFSEVFSIYYYIIADVFTALCSANDNTTYSKREIIDIIKKSVDKYQFKAGTDTKFLIDDELFETLVAGGFLLKTTRIIDGKFEYVKNVNGSGYDKKPAIETVFRPKYKCESAIEFYRDIVPLSTIEIRWLKTIIHDENRKIHLFMSESEINVLEAVLKQYTPSITELTMNRVNYFDRFHFQKKNAEAETTVLPILLDGIYNQKTIRIRYRTMKNRTKIGEFKPIILEFSKRNNRFQGFFQECGDNRICTMNISRIETAIETENSFDYSDAEQSLHLFRERNTMSVEVEFYNVRNITDRILTEFSPWKKRCAYDKTSGLYKLTIFYQQQDEMDLVVRLLGYGSNLRFVDKKHPIYKEIQARMNRQMDLIRENRSSHSNREPGDNR